MLFPIYDVSHYYLIVYDNIHQTIEAYDPYDFGSCNIELQATMVTENKVYLEQTLSFLVNTYLKPKFEAIYEGIILEPTLMVYTPPDIPSQVNDSDCTVFLLQFAISVIQRRLVVLRKEEGRPFILYRKQNMSSIMKLKQLIDIY